MSVKHTFEMTF